MRQLGIEGFEAGELVEPRQTGEPGMLVGRGKGRPPERHDPVAEILVDDAVVLAHRLRHDGQITVHHGHERRGRHLLAKAGEVLHVAEQDRHLTARAAGIGEFGAVDQSCDDARIDVFAKGLANLRLDAQLGHHVVEGRGQAADLVARGDRHDSIERALLDRSRARKEAPHRPHETRRHRRGDNEAEQPRQGQQCQTDLHDALLKGTGAEDRRAGEAAHLDTGGFDAAIEIVAPSIELGENPVLIRALAGGGDLQQLRQDRFVAAALLLQEFDVCIEPRQRDSVVEIDRVGDQLVQALARLGELLVARLGGGPGALPEILDLCRIGRRSFVERQEKAADIGRFLDRMDVGLGEAHIGREIIFVEHDELGVDSAGHAHAEPRRCTHQHEEAGRNPEDLDADRNVHRGPRPPARFCRSPAGSLPAAALSSRFAKKSRRRETRPLFAARAWRDGGADAQDI